ncbi:MAG TPA: N-acetylmuramoyl-L-alanine amidase [Solirubrobacterales bacterium]|nr:N-acetylmuramoyl-L-alanine amidase [Solirubrobacterales bacterium]
MIGTHLIATVLTALSLAGSHAPAARAEALVTHAAAARPLAGKVVGIDPGHNGGNFSDPDFINQPVWNGREEEACDTTGTETDGGYTEARFNFDVATYLRAYLLHEGAKVVMTRRTNHGVGPCITRRARILDKARADVAIDIHADGGPASGRGVAILTPVPDGPNDKVIASSKRFGRILLHRYTTLTGIPISNYDGSGGFAPRDNLAGLNLTTVPKVLIECVNMRNPTDAARLVKPAFQRLAAKSMVEAITAFLR